MYMTSFSSNLNNFQPVVGVKTVQKPRGTREGQGKIPYIHICLYMSAITRLARVGKERSMQHQCPASILLTARGPFPGLPLSPFSSIGLLVMN